MKIICECTHGAFHTCCVTVCFLQQGTFDLGICVCFHACSLTRMCSVCLIRSIWPLRLSSGAPGVNVSQNPSLSRPPEALNRLCVSVCVYSVAGRGKHSSGESHYELRVCEMGVVLMCVY